MWKKALLSSCYETHKLKELTFIQSTRWALKCLLMKGIKEVSLRVKFKWINILTGDREETGLRELEGEKRIIVCFCSERVLFFGSAERQPLLSGGTGHLRSHILIVALRPELHEPPEEAYPRLSPRFTWNCGHESDLSTVSLSVSRARVCRHHRKTLSDSDKNGQSDASSRCQRNTWQQRK